MDLRVTKTYLALTNAFQELLSEKSFEDITVNELCDRAMIRRATFYKHFADKYEFFAFMVKEIQENYDAERRSRETVSEGKEELVDIIRYALDYVEENSGLVRSVLQSSALDVLLHILSEQMYTDVLSRFCKAEINGNDLPSDPELMAQVFTGALLQVMVWWATQRKPMEKEKLVKELSKILARI